MLLLQSHIWDGQNTNNRFKKKEGILIESDYEEKSFKGLIDIVE